MNRPAPDFDRNGLERLLSVLAAEDRELRAAPQVRTAVMRTWDLGRPSIRHGRWARGRFAMMLASGSLAAALVVLVVMDRASSVPHRTEPVAARAVEQPRVVANVSTVEHATPTNARGSRKARSRSHTLVRHDQVLLLGIDPTLDGTTTSVVRVRVPRAALATLGLPVAQSDASGLIDLEMLVGEDGVARVIRRAVPVAFHQE